MSDKNQPGTSAGKRGIYSPTDKVPQIIINRKLVNHAKFVKYLKQLLDGDRFRQAYKVSTVNDFSMDREAHRRICVSFREDKVKRSVLKAAPNMDVKEIKRELAAGGHTPADVFPLKDKKSYAYSYLINFPLANNIGEVRKISFINYVKVTWERYAKRSGCTQCFRCHKFGHIVG